VKCPKLAAVAVGVAVVASALAVAPGSLPASARPSPVGIRAADARPQATPSPAVTVGAKLGAWGNAREVPGTAALNKGGSAWVQAASCGKPGSAPGNCAIVGVYTDANHHTQTFVAGEKSGVWGTAIEVPGTASLNKGNGGQHPALACASPDNCAVTGSYTDAHGQPQFFVADEKNGTWGNARVLSNGHIPGVITRAPSIACGTTGDCAVTGTYKRDDNATLQAFVADERGGAWGPAITVPGSDGLNIGGAADGLSVSCAAAGVCTVAGDYTNVNGTRQALVADERSGAWGQAMPLTVADIPGNPPSGAIPAQASFASCASAGDCAVTGTYDASQIGHVFVADERNGTWTSGRALPGEATLANSVVTTSASAISCADAGDCAVGGEFAGAGGPNASYVADERSGTWTTAQQLFGTADFNTASFADINAMSCAADGDCTVGGAYPGTDGNAKAFTASQVDGSWRGAAQVPGLAALHGDGISHGLTAACGTPGNCVTGGYFNDAAHRPQAFIADQSTVTATALALSTPAVRPGHADAEKLTVQVTARFGGPPAGTVTVTADEGTTVCVITLDATGKGGCAVKASLFGPGNYPLTAAYGGSDAYGASRSAARALTVTRHGAWGNARPVPGVAALGKGTFADMGEAACASAGTCTAIGTYSDASGNAHAFVVTEKNGTWGNAVPLPGTAALGKVATDTGLIACASASDCSAVGIFGSGTIAAATPATSRGHHSAASSRTAAAASASGVFVSDEKNGAWGNARPLPGLSALDAGKDAFPADLSCRSKGNCTLDGGYTDSQGHRQVFVADERDGTWTSAIEVPGLAALNKGDAQPSTIACATAGRCVVAGTYSDAATGGHTHAFVADEAGGHWGPAHEITLGPGTSDAVSEDVACPVAGGCVLTGDYLDGSGTRQAFVAQEANGTWDPNAVQAIPGVASLAAGGVDFASAIACASPGNCEAAGVYALQSGTDQSYVASEHGGSWSDARKLDTVPGRTGLVTQVRALFCPSAGNCVAAGRTDGAHGSQDLFVANEAGGAWGRAGLIPGILSLENGGFATLSGLTCPASGTCVITGDYVNAVGHVFVAEQSPATATTLTLSAATVRAGHEQTEKLTVTVRPRTAGTPAGTVTIKAGGTPLCTLTLSAGRASCLLRPSQLRPGAFQLTVTYNGSDIYDRSTSAPRKLTVTR
jgi:hypothetical protein